MEPSPVPSSKNVKMSGAIVKAQHQNDLKMNLVFMNTHVLKLPVIMANTHSVAPAILTSILV